MQCLATNDDKDIGPCLTGGDSGADWGATSAVCPAWANYIQANCDSENSCGRTPTSDEVSDICAEFLAPNSDTDQPYCGDDPNAKRLLPPSCGDGCATTCHACSSMLHMDYGGNPTVVDNAGTAVECGYAPIVLIIASDPAFDGFSFYDGEIIIDSTLDSPLACQNRCYEHPDCDFFGYEHEYVDHDGDSVLYHKCYLKQGYDDVNCASNPYTPWSTESQVHSESGPGVFCETPCHVCGEDGMPLLPPWCADWAGLD